MIQSAKCIDTKDPLKQGRIKFSCGDLSDWANPLAEEGAEITWVPPEGSEIALLHHTDGLYYYVGTCLCQK